jgi:sugar phosphate isomerase/epimerase
MSLTDWAREAVQLKLDAIDISILMLKGKSDGELRRIRTEINQEGICVGGASTYPDFTNPDPAARARQKVQFERDLETLAAVGTQIVRITAGQAHPGLDQKEGIKLALEGITGSIPKAEELGIQLVFENHAKPGVWQYYDFDYPTDIFLEIASGLTDTPVRIQFDTANPIAYGDEPLPILKQVYDKVSVVHIADTKSRGELNPTVIGTGLVEFKEIFDYLNEKDYSQWLSIEEASFTGSAGIKTAVDFVRKMWTKHAALFSE